MQLNQIEEKIMAKKKSSRTIVGTPLTPVLLGELKALDKLPQTPADFKPDGNWVNSYHIWTCHGYRESGNQDVGFLRIERLAGTANETFTLKVNQQVDQTDGLTNIVDAVVKCRNNQLASPIQWEVSSRFIGADGKKIAKLQSNDSNTATESVDRKTSDWCLFELVQRLKFNESIDLAFDLLDGLSIAKQNQRLKYRGAETAKLGDRQARLHCFSQIGRGILPTEYWLDDNHRLLLVCSMNKAYILNKPGK